MKKFVSRTNLYLHFYKCNSFTFMAYENGSRGYIELYKYILMRE